MKDLILHFFQAKSFPELAVAVRARAAVVLLRWENAVKEILPSADELTRTQLRNALPDTLENLAAALESNHANPTRALLDDSQEHGAMRCVQSYNLAELLVEFDVLRPILMEEAALHMKRDITLGEVIALNMGVDLAARRSVLAFVNHQRVELEAAANAHAKYLSFMSHDVRGGLNAILLSTDVLYQDLRDQPQFAQALADVAMIKRNILDTVATMDRFLKAEQLRSGRVAPRLADVDLRELVQDLGTQFRHQAAAKGIQVTIDAGDDGIIRSDRELLATILQNLVGNAIKYSTRGEVKVTVRKGHGSGTSIAVVDQGPGIDPQRLDQLFTPFVRGETHGQTGIGLGLFIARQAAEVLGATLRAESKLGEGTTFTLTLPG
ncbi:MAG TPA: HAMP domain-containing sensor histidine kinase [Tepidisphaeraceae bacterium]|jgi:signal transduction histidine kinase